MMTGENPNKSLDWRLITESTIDINRSDFLPAQLQNLIIIFCLPEDQVPLLMDGRDVRKRNHFLL